MWRGGRESDLHENAELRSVLEPLGEMPARLGVTIIANTHLSKAAVGSANSRVIGSVAFVNQARAACIVVADPEDSDRRLAIRVHLPRGERSCQSHSTFSGLMSAAHLITKPGLLPTSGSRVTQFLAALGAFPNRSWCATSSRRRGPP